MKKITFLLFILIPLIGYGQLTPVKHPSGLYGYANAAGEMIIDYQYSAAFPFIDKFGLVHDGSGYKLIDQVGNKISAFNFSVMGCVPTKKAFSFKTDSTIGLITTVGVILEEIKYHYSYDWLENNEGFLIMQGEKIGFFHMSHGLVLPVEYITEDLLTTFNWDGNLYFSDSSYFALKRGDKWGVISMYGDIRIPFEYDKLIQRRDDHIGAKKNNKWALIDKISGAPLTEFIYDGFLGRYSAPMMISRNEDPYIFLKDKKIQFYDLSTKKTVSQVPKGEYEWQSPDFLNVIHNNKMGVIDRTGKIIIEFEYDKISDCSNFTKEQANNFPPVSVTKNGMSGLIVPGKGFVFPMMECDDIRAVLVENEIFYFITKKSKKALYNSKKKAITDFIYDDMNLYENEINVIQGTKVGVLSTKGDVKWDE